MGARRDLDAMGIDSYRVPPAGLTFQSPVTDGPAGVVGRKINVHLDMGALGRLVAYIAEVEPDLVLRVAAAIVEADTLAASDQRCESEQYRRRERRGTGGGMLPYGRIRLLSAAARDILPTTEEVPHV